MSPKRGGQGKNLHHFVPRSFLRAFADSEGRLLAVLRDPYEVRDVHVNTVAAEQHFYKLRSADGSLSDDLEDELAAFDGTIPKTVSAATSGRHLRSAHISRLRRLYAVLAARGHLGRDYIAEEVRDVRELIEREYDKMVPQDDPELREYILDRVIRKVWKHPDEYAADPQTVSRASVLSRSEEIVKAMPRFGCVIEAAPELEFFTSDAPFCSFDPENPPPQEGVYGSPFSAPRIELTLATDRRHAVLFANEPLPRRAKGNAAVTSIINARSIFFAKRMVLAYNSEEAVAGVLATLEIYRERSNISLLDAFLPKAA